MMKTTGHSYSDGATHTMAVVVLVCLAGCVFFYRLTAPSLWLDELHHKIIAERPVRDILNIRQPGYEFVIFSHGYEIINHYTMRLCDSLEFALRAPQAVSALISLVFVYLLARHLFTPGAGLLAMLLLIANPMYVHYTSQNRLYHISTLGFLATYYFFLRLCEERRAGWWIGFVLAASFMLRVNTYGGLMLAATAPLALVLFGLGWLPERVRPYNVTWRTLAWLAVAAAVIALLFMPFTVVAIRQVLAKGTDASLNDAWWVRPFPLSITALLRFMSDNYAALPRGPRLYGLLSLAAVAGAVVVQRGRAVVFFAACAGLTLGIIHFMNQSRAVIEPKRFLYLVPLMYLWLAGGAAMLVEVASRAVERTAPTRKWLCAALVRAGGWLLVIRYLALPELGAGMYAIGQDKFKERVPYKLLAQVFTFQAYRTDQLWWSPHENDSWLMEQYVPATAFVRPRPRDARTVTRAAIDEALAAASGLWLHNINPADHGFASNQFIRLPVLWTTTYLIRPEYLTNAWQRDQDEERLLKAAVGAAAFPHVEAAALLIQLLQRRGAVHEADQVAAAIGRFRASQPACNFATEYFERRGQYGKAFSVWRRFADLYFWRAEANMRAAHVAARAGDYAMARRYARRAALFDTAYRGASSEFEARGLWQEGKHERALHATRAALAELMPVPAARVPGEQFRATLDFAGTVFSGAGTSADKLVLGLCEWSRSYPLHNMTGLWQHLDECLTNGEARTALWDGMRQWYWTFPALGEFTLAWQAPAGSKRRLAHMRALRDQVSVPLWPVYSWALYRLAETNWRGELVVPWARVRELGFTGMDWPRLAWYERYVQDCTGLKGVVGWWDELVELGTVTRAQAAVRQSELELAAGVDADIAARLDAHFDAIAAREIETQRAINVLRQMTSTVARVLLQRFGEAQQRAHE